jgi:hypothetical protein
MIAEGPAAAVVALSAGVIEVGQMSASPSAF